MELKHFENSNMITFSTKVRIAYGNQIILLSNESKQTAPDFTVILPNNEHATIKIEGKQIQGGSFIVVQCKPAGRKKYRCLAVNSDDLDRSSEKIENNLISELSAQSI